MTDEDSDGGCDSRTFGSSANAGEGDDDRTPADDRRADTRTPGISPRASDAAAGASVSERRRFLYTLGALGLSSVAGCLGGGGDSEASASEDDSTNSTVPRSVSSEERPYVLSGGEVATTYDVEYAPEAVVIGGDDLETLDEVDPDEQRYAFDADALDERGFSIESGSVLLLSGLALRRVTAVEEDGSRVVVETEPASLDEAISEGTVAWDAELGFSAERVPTPADDLGGDGPSGTGAIERPPESALSGAHFLGVYPVDSDGARLAAPTGEFSNQEETAAFPMDWSYAQGDQTYKFRLSQSGEGVEIEVQVTKGAGTTSGKETLAYTATGRLGTLRSAASANFADGELESMEYQQRDLAGEVELSLAAAGAGYGEIDWEFPGLMFKFLVFVGPVPITVGINTKIVGEIQIPAGASATAEASFAYDGDAGFAYEAGVTEAKTNMTGLEVEGKPADSAANFGNAVDAQFGVAFPRVSVSVFDQLLVPYLHTGMTIGSKLTWGPICKSAYAKLVVEAGYDLAILGATLASHKETLAERERRAEGDNCSAT